MPLNIVDSIMKVITRISKTVVMIKGLMRSLMNTSTTILRIMMMLSLLR